MEQLINYFLDKKVDSILDAGTGSGDFISVIKPIFPEAKITGIDTLTEALESAKINFPEVDFREMGAENLLFEDNSFDLVTISMALHHLSKLKKGLKELKRVVKPGGWLIINELFSDNLNPAQEVHKLFHHFRSHTDRLLGISHRETFKKAEIIQMVREAGISVQFYFEWKKNPMEPFGAAEIEERAAKMENMLEQVKKFPDYQQLKPRIAEFRELALKHGFQPATNVVIVGRKQ